MAYASCHGKIELRSPRTAMQGGAGKVPSVRKLRLKTVDNDPVISGEVEGKFYSKRKNVH